MTSLEIPAFDPQSPDVEILEAYEKVRAHRAWAYSFDRLADTDRDAWSAFCNSSEVEAKDEEIAATEACALDNWAQTPSGVAAQIILSITGGLDRWADSGLVTHGLNALYHARAGLDGRDQAIIAAAYNLLHIEFEQAFEAWERAKTSSALALDLKAVIEQAERDGGDGNPWLASLIVRYETLEARLTDHSQVCRLMRTLAPDWACYQRKARTMLAEGYGEAAGPWLLRDVQFLMGAIAPEQEAA